MKKNYHNFKKSGCSRIYQFIQKGCTTAIGGGILGILTIKFTWKAPFIIIAVFIICIMFFIPELYLLLYIFVDQMPFLQLRTEVFSLLSVSWIIYVFANKIKLVVTPIEKTIIAFALLYILLSTITGPFLKVIEYINLIVLYFIISTIINSEQRLKRLIYGFILLGLLLSMGGILQVFLQKTIFPTVISEIGGNESGVIMAVGSYGDPVVYSGAVFFSMILCFFQMLASSKKRSKLILFVILILLVFGCLSSGNRATMISLIIIISIMIIIDRKLSFKMLIAIIFALILIPSLILPYVLQRFVSIIPTFTSFYYQMETHIRYALLVAAIEFLLDHPIRLFAGVGSGNFAKFVLPYLKQQWDLIGIGGGFTTSSIVVVLVEGGVMGLVLLTTASCLAISEIVKVRKFYEERSNHEMFLISNGFLFLEIGIIVRALLDNTVYTYLFWLPLGLITAIRRISIGEGTIPISRGKNVLTNKDRL